MNVGESSDRDVPGDNDGAVHVDAPATCSSMNDSIESDAPVSAGAFDPIAYINTPRWMQVRPGLERIEALLDAMGRPQDSLRFVHVAGTNGKGSTCAMIESVLRTAGYKTGLFTSPYIMCFEERIRVNGKNIPLDALTDVTLFVKHHVEALEAAGLEHPTEFELMTAVAFEYFKRMACDIVVAEVGMGGRLDSTNVIEHPEVCVIASLSLDHTEFLGDTLAAIAGEKAGIIKPGSPVVSAPQKPEAMEVIAAVAEECGCPLTLVDRAALSVGNLQITEAARGATAVGTGDSSIATVGEMVPCSAASMPDISSTDTSACTREHAACADREHTRVVDESRPWSSVLREFEYKGETYCIPLLARYQPENAALALEALRALKRQGWSLSQEQVFRGLATVSWPGRFEVVGEHPLTIVDGAHNAQGVDVLAESLRELSSFAPVVFVMGVLADKDYPAMVDTILSLADAVITITPTSPRALSATDLADFINRTLVQGAVGSEFHSAEDSISSDAAISMRVAECSVGAPGGSGVPYVHAAQNVEAALREAKTLAGESGMVVAFGSLYSIAALKTALNVA